MTEEEIKQLEAMDFEPVGAQIQGLRDQVNQMKRMVEENERKIAEGDDVEGRTFLMEHLKSEIESSEDRIAKLEGYPTREEGQELSEDLEEAYSLLYGEE